MSSVATIERQPSPIAEARIQLGQMEEQFKRALPAHIPVERFARVVMTAIQNNGNLVTKCSRQSLWNACMRAAQDGLLPDGRDGAIVEYGTQAQWMPMIGGIRKKVRNSGEIVDWYAYVVYDGDEFDYQLGDTPRVHHKPVPPSLRGKGGINGIVAAYSVAVLKDGYRTPPEVMWVEEIEGVRSKARSQKGPWSDPIFYPEMCRKTVARRHSKVLPMSSDLDDLIRRDDHLYDLDTVREEAQGARPKLGAALDRLAHVQEDDQQQEQPSGASADNAPGEDAGGTPAAADASRPVEADATTVSPATPSHEQPEEFLTFVTEQFNAAGTEDALDAVWEHHVAPVLKKMIPPDRDEFLHRRETRRQQIQEQGDGS